MALGKLGEWFVDAITWVNDHTVFGWITKQITDVPKTPNQITDNHIQQQLNPDYSRPVVYGEQELAGNLIFYNTTGTDNKYLDMVIDICEGEIQGIEKVYMNDEPIALFDAGIGVEFIPNTKILATNPLYGAIKATGTLSFSVMNGVNFLSGYIFSINDVSFIAGTDFSLGATLTDSINNLVTALNASINPSVSAATYSNVNNDLYISYDTAGIIGNGKAYFFKHPDNFYNYASVILSGGRDLTYAEAYFYNGTDAQTVNTQLQSAYAGWDANHALPGVAYMYVRMTFNQDLFQGGIPQFKFKLRGKKVFDDRTSTTIYSNNPAVCLKDYLTNSRYGKGLSSSYINTASVISAANTCDTLRNGLDVSGNPITYKSYTLGAVVDTAQTLKTNTEYFLQAMNGGLPYIDGVYFMTIFGAGNGTVTISEQDIIGPLNISSPGKKDKLNKVIISFPDKDRHYKVGEAPYPIGLDTSNPYLTEDGQILSKTITAPYVTYYPQAIDIAELAVNMSRIKSGLSFTTTQKILENVPGDIVNITYDTLGWSAKEFRLNQVTIRPDGLCDVVLIEHFDSFFSLTQKQEQITPNNTTLKSPYDVTRPIITSILSDTTTHLVSIEGLVQPRIYLTWTNYEDYCDGHIIYKKKSTDSTFVEVGRVSKLDATAYYISGLEWGIQYDVGVETINGIGIRSQMVVASITVPNPLTDAIYTYPNVTGLELIGRGTDEGQGNNYEFQGKDIRLQWRLSSNNVIMEFGSIGSEVIGGSGGVIPFTLKGYKVKVFHPGDTQPRQTYTVTDPHFTYTLDKNIEDGLGTASRTVTFEVIAFGQVQGYGIDGESAIAAKLTATNPQPSLPTAVNFEPNFQSFRFSYIRPTDADYKAIKLWIGTSTGFVRNNASLVYDGPDNNIVIQGLISGTTYYARFLAYDDFGEAGATESAEYTFTLPQAISGDEVTSITASKITSGTLAEQVNVAGVFVATGTETVMNKTFTGSTWRLELGPVTVGGTTYVARYHNGTTTYFSVDSVGNAVFGGALSAATGTFAGALSAATGTFGAITVASSGSISGGQTAYDTGTGFWIGDVSGTKKFSIGNSAGAKLLWNGTDLTVTTLKTSSGSGQRVELNPSGDNQLHFYGSNGTVVEQLAVIGISTVGGNDVVGYFGSNTSTNARVGIYTESYSSTALIAKSNSGIAGDFTSNNSIAGQFIGSTYGVWSQGSTTGIYGIGGSYGVIAEASGTATGAFRIIPKSNTTDPTEGGTAQRGTFYVRSDGVLRFHDGTSWKTVTVA